MTTFTCFCKGCIVAMVVLGGTGSVEASDLAGTATWRNIPIEDQSGPRHYITVGGATAGAADPAPVYANYADSYVTLRVPDAAAGPIWVADDMELTMDGAQVVQYSYLTYCFTGGDPYHVDSALYKFESACADGSLVDWDTRDCCTSPVPIPGTEGSVDVPTAGMTWVTVTLGSPVVVPQYIFMYLEYSGATIADNGGWMIAGSCDDFNCANGPDYGFTDDFWTEDIDGVGCGLFWFGGDPYAGFAADVWAVSGAAMEMLPELASGTYTIAGDTITLDCTDLPQNVTFGVYARDWDPYTVNYWATAIDCCSYGGDCSPPYLGPVDIKCPGSGCDNLPYQFGADKHRTDYIFYGISNFPACSNIPVCADDPYPGFGPGAFVCLSAIEGSVPDTGRKFINYYSFVVPSGARGIYEVRLDPDPLYTQLAAPGGVQILPLALNPGYISLECGYCLYNVGPGTTECTDWEGCMCYTDCPGLPGATVWNADAGCECPAPPWIECTLDEHCDDGDPCTGVEVCVPLGQCQHVLAADCNSNDIEDECDIAGSTSYDCRPNAVPDECDIAEGTSADVNGNGIPDECDARRPMPEDCATIAPGPGTRCSFDGTCDPSHAEPDDDCLNESYCVPAPNDEFALPDLCYATKTRYVSIARHPEQVPNTARRVRLDGYPPEDFEYWVAAPNWNETTAGHEFWFAALVDAPVYAGSFPTPDGDWPDLLHVSGCEIAPGYTYLIQALPSSGDPDDEDDYSEPLYLRTNTTWGDVTGQCPGGLCEPANGIPGLDDVVAELGFFAGTPVAPLQWLDITPSTDDNSPDQNIGIGDVLAVLDGFTGGVYPGNGPLGCGGLSPHVSEYSDSGCLPGRDRGRSDGYPWCGDDEVEFTVVGPGTLHVMHRNATYWCAQEEIVIRLSVEGYLLKLTEEEVNPEPTDCLCCYNVEATVVDLQPGEYTVEFCWNDYESGWQQVCYTEVIEIP